MSHPRSLNKANLNKDDEVILQHYIVADYKAALAYAKEITERKEIPNSKICRDLIAVVNKAYLIDKTRLGALQEYLSVMKNLASKIPFFNIAESLSIMIKDDSDPVKTILTQQTFNEICREAFAIGSNRSLLTFIGYPLAIGQAVKNALDSNRYMFDRGKLIGCYAILMLTQNSARIQQHFGLNHDEINSLDNLRYDALTYYISHSKKWPEFKAFDEKREKLEGSLYPLVDLINEEHLFREGDVTSAFLEFLNLDLAQFENYKKLHPSVKVNVQNAVEHKSESEESKQKEGVASKVILDLEERKEGQVVAPSSPLSALSFLTKTPEAKQNANPLASIPAQPRAISPRSQPNLGFGIVNEIEGAEPGQAEMKTLTLTITAFTEGNDKQIGELSAEDVPYNTDLIMAHMSNAIDIISDANKDPKKFTFTLENSAGSKVKLPIPLDLKTRKELVDRLLNRWLAPSFLNMPAEHKEPGASFQLSRKR